MQFDLALNLNTSLSESETLEFSDFLWFHKRLYDYLESSKPKTSTKVVISRGR